MRQLLLRPNISVQGMPAQRGPCGLCGQYAQPAGHYDVFLEDGGLVCRDCAAKKCPELAAAQRVIALLYEGWYLDSQTRAELQRRVGAAMDDVERFIAESKARIRSGVARTP